jgi:hypothetical protein
MEYLWEEERAVDFAYWLEDNRIKNENLGYWEQMKHPSGYYNSDAFPFTPLVPHNRVDMITSQGIAKNLMKEQAEHGPWTYQPKIRALEKLLVTEQVPARFHQYLLVFEQKASERMPTCKPWDHAIDLKLGFQLRKGKIYLLNPEEQKEVQDFVDAQLKKKYIRSSKSPQMSPVFFIAKKDGKKQMVQDYHHINEVTIKNNYPLPLISELVDRAGMAKVFTKLDLQWGYNNVRIKEGDEWKAAFSTHIGSYKPVVMFFGLTNLPAMFQTMMNELFRDMIDEGKVIIYIDDILIYSKNEQGHDEIIEEVLCRLAENDLYIKPEKCFWKVKEVEFLRVIIGPNRIKMDPGKIDAILEWPELKNMKDIQQFIGLANYYQRFIRTLPR